MIRSLCPIVVALLSCALIFTALRADALEDALERSRENTKEAISTAEECIDALMRFTGGER